MTGCEYTPTDAESKGIRAGIKTGQLCIREMEIPEINAPVIFSAQNINPQRPGWREIEMGFAPRNFLGADHAAAAKFYVRGNSMVRLQIPFHDPRVESETIGLAPRLKHHYDGQRIESIFKSAAKKARAVRIGEDPAISETGGPLTIALGHAV